MMRHARLLAAVLCCAAARLAAAEPEPLPLLVVGSVNVDLTVAVERLPQRGECISSSRPVSARAVGGKVSAGGWNHEVVVVE